MGLKPFVLVRDTHLCVSAVRFLTFCFFERSGSYSHFAVGNTAADIESLAHPEWNGVLGFAGEHTIFEGQGTVEGAIASGMREADRIATCSVAQ